MSTEKIYAVNEKVEKNSRATLNCLVNILTTVTLNNLFVCGSHNFFLLQIASTKSLTQTAEQQQKQRQRGRFAF